MHSRGKDGLVRARIIVSGCVQGVSFRWYTRTRALELEVSGWVRNLPDGSVELVAEGSLTNVQNIVDWCRQGPSHAVVDDLKVGWEDATGEFSEFAIHH